MILYSRDFPERCCTSIKCSFHLCNVSQSYFHPFHLCCFQTLIFHFHCSISISIYFLIANESLVSYRINSYLLCMRTHCVWAQPKSIYAVGMRMGMGKRMESWKEKSAEMCRMPQRYTRPSIEIRNKSKIIWSFLLDVKSYHL